MKSLSISLLVMFLVGVCSTSVLSASPDKVVVCHNQQCPEGDVHGNSSITLEITENALQSHLNHGDTVGACVECEGDECNADCEFDEDCNDNQICDTQTGECVDTNKSCNNVVCDEGFGCVFGECFALVINNGEQGPTGPGGSDGLDGQNGIDGEDGKDGSSCTVIAVDNCAAIHCDDGTEALVCNGQDGASCTVEKLSGNVLVSCPDGTSVAVGNTNFDDDGDGITNDVDQCPGTQKDFWVDKVGCMLVQKQPPPTNLPVWCNENDSVCGLCGTGCILPVLMLFMSLMFLKKRGV